MKRIKTYLKTRNLCSFCRLVLKHGHSFFINGDNIISDSGIYKAAGAVFDYRRIDDAIDTNDENTGVTEWITATGPVREPIHLMVIVFVELNLVMLKN